MLYVTKARGMETATTTVQASAPDDKRTPAIVAGERPSLEARPSFIVTASAASVSDRERLASEINHLSNPAIVHLADAAAYQL
jgi:hypothetical protein